MQITRYKPRYIEKILKTEEGIFLARFVVVSEGNSLKLKLVEMIPQEKASEISNSILFLSSPKITQIYGKTLNILTEIISPYTNFEFFFSQPTRAPSSL